MNITEINGLNLAYIGDAVIELYVRKKLVLNGGKIGQLNKDADKMVSAVNQSKIVDRLQEQFTEEELNVYKRGKNSHINSVPKSATQLEYRKATGFEALFGYLYLKNDDKRIEELLDLAFFANTKED